MSLQTGYLLNGVPIRNTTTLMACRFVISQAKTAEYLAPTSHDAEYLAPTPHATARDHVEYANHKILYRPAK